MKCAKCGDGMMRTTVCNYCSYRYDFDASRPVAYCPICGASSRTEDLRADSWPSMGAE